MKKLLCYSFLFVFLMILSCQKKTSLSSKQQENIKREVKEVVNQMIRGAEEANASLILTTWHNSPDFVATTNGTVLSFKEISELLPKAFESVSNMKFSPSNEIFNILDESTVIYTTVGKMAENFKAGHSLIDDPLLWQFVLRKSDGKWIIVNASESYTSMAQVPQPKLNQSLLIKQITGKWKIDYAKDTVVYWEGKSFGLGLETVVRTEVKGKVISEGKQLFGYDSKLDKFIGVSSDNDKDPIVVSLWFTSNNKFAMTFPVDLRNPYNSSFRAEGEVKSPDLVTQTEYVNGRMVSNLVYKRVK